MYEVIPQSLWIGNAMDARNPRLVLDTGIAAVVDLAYEEPPAQLPRELIYCRFPLLDGLGNDPALLRLAVDAVQRLQAARTPTLVACSAGMNRSPIIVAVALATIRNEPADLVLQQLVESRPHDISRGLWDDVLRASGMVPGNPDA
jgi:protein-tyrosine phosphatase